MKRFLSLLLMVCLALPLGGCAGKQAAWRYELETRDDADDYTARDGTLLTWYSYELPRLALVSGGARNGMEPPEDMAAALDAFNAEMENQHALLLDEYREMEQLAIRSYIESAEDFSTACGNHIELAETYQTPRFLSIRAAGYANWGGAYPWAFVRTWGFDLETGKFVQWYDLANDPDTLRAALAEEIIRQIRERDMDEGFYDGWDEEVERFNGCSVYLGEDALTVIFGEQLLGPHAAGMPEFTISYSGLSEYLNDYGKRLLKKEG